MVLSRILAGCLVVFSIGSILVGDVTAQNQEVSTDIELKIVQLKATEHYTFIYFQPESTIKKVVTEGANLKVRIFEGNDTTGKSVLLEDLTGPFLGLESANFKRFQGYFVDVLRTDSSGKSSPVLKATFTSSPGEPSEVNHPEWEMSDDGDSSKATLHWSPPSMPQGPINGYEIKHCFRDIINKDQRNGSNTEEPPRVCETMETPITSLEIDVVRGKRYDTHIRAFNDVEPEFGAQGKPRLSGKWKTVYPTNDKIPSGGGNNAAVAVLIVISVLLSLVIVGYAGYKYYRKNYN